MTVQLRLMRVRAIRRELRSSEHHAALRRFALHSSSRARLALVGTLVTMALAAPAAQAAITVNTTADPGAAGQCSLRKAIQAANNQSPAGDCAAADALPGTTTINVPPGHYTLGTQLEITGSANVFIEGGTPGDPSTTVLDAAQHDRVLQVDSGANATLDSVTVTGGKSADGAPGGCCQMINYNPNGGITGGYGADGGGIYNSGTLALTNSAVTGNATGHGGDGGGGGAGGAGGYWNGGTGGDGGAGGRGGGIYNYYFATLTLSDTSVSDNHTGAGGRGGNGGGGATQPPPSPCASPCGGVFGGSGGPGGSGGAGGSGGGIDDQGASLTIFRSTLNNNQTGAGGDAGTGGNGSNGSAGEAGAFGGAGGFGGGDPNARAGSGGRGGGIYDEGHGLAVSYSTISADVTGGGGNGGGGGDGGNGMGDHASGGNGGNASGGGSGGAGGGIGLDVYQSLAVTNSTVANNVTGAGGAAGSGGPGGAGYLTGAGGGPGNGGAGGTGGGIFTNTGTLTFATIAGNHTSAGGPGGATGAGCQPTCGTSANGTDGAYGTGAGIEVNGTPGISMANTLVASNLVPGGVQNCVNHSSSAIGDGGYNLSYGDATCPGINGNPLLGPLQNNGGTTQTLALGGGSAAIDQIPVASAGCPGIDQRGVSRPLPTGGQCDIGAFEAGFAGRTLTVTVSGPGSGNVSGTGIDCGGGPTHTTCSTTAADGAQITLSATPASGSQFGSFSGGGCGATSPCTVSMNADTNVDARFDKPPPAPLPPKPPPPPPPTGGSGGSGAGAGPSSGAGSSVAMPGKALIGHPKVSGTTVSIPVTCTGAAGATCSVTAALSIIEKLRGGKLIAVTAAKVKSRVLVLGLTRIVINVGQTRTVRVSLNGIGQRFLATRRMVRTRLVVSQSGRAISTSIIHFKPKKTAKRAGR